MNIVDEKENGVAMTMLMKTSITTMYQNDNLN